jgi:hypothetical protein
MAADGSAPLALVGPADASDAAFPLSRLVALLFHQLIRVASGISKYTGVELTFKRDGQICLISSRTVRNPV